MADPEWRGSKREKSVGYTPPPPYGEPHTYPMFSPSTVGPQERPVKECRGRAVTRMAMRVHFLHRHVRETVSILEEATSPTHGAPGVTLWYRGRL